MYELNVQGMSCAHCVNAIIKAVRGVDPNASVDVDLSGKRVAVESAVSRQLIESAIVDAGYTVQQG